MALTPSNMLELGTKAPDFNLMNAVTQLPTTLNDVMGKKGLWVMFICNHCPYVVHIRKQLVKVAHEVLEKGIGVVAINSNSIESHPQDGPIHMKALATEEGWRFPFLFDETQEVAKAYQAACTPDLYLFDASGMLVYRGQFDDSRPGKEVPVTGDSFLPAVDALISGQPPLERQVPSMGCNIKWAVG